MPVHRVVGFLVTTGAKREDSIYKGPRLAGNADLFAISFIPVFEGGIWVLVAPVPGHCFSFSDIC